MKERTAQEVIQQLELQPLPVEGGYFRFLTYFGESSGCIYYLVTADSFSCLHSLTEDEMYFFLEGDAVEQTIVYPDGRMEKRILNGENRDSLIEKNCYQATKIREPRLGYALLTTIMNPSYRDEMFRMAKDDPAIRENEVLRGLM